MTPLLEARDLHVSFDITREGDMPWRKPRKLQAVNGINFSLNAGETLGIVGESGCGKSTLARALIQMVPATGRVVWQGGQDLLALNARQMLPYRADIQMVFQDPLASLNPRMTIGQIIAEPLRMHHPDLPASDIKARVQWMMDRVGLLPNQINRYPHEFSGGQCQRIGIARALILEPKLLICDEPVSALDVSIQAQVINLLAELRRELGLAMIFIAHDLSVVKHISDRVMVLYLGRVMELERALICLQIPAIPIRRPCFLPCPCLIRSAKGPRGSFRWGGICPRLWRRHRAVYFAPAAPRPLRNASVKSPSF